MTDTAPQVGAHTPGPWRWLDDVDDVLVGPEYDREKDYQAEVVIYGSPRMSPSPGDARLIAAAPDLLAERDALRAVLVAQGHELDPVPQSVVGEFCAKCFKPWLCPAAKAIASARGEEAS